MCRELCDLNPESTENSIAVPVRNRVKTMKSRPGSVLVLAAGPLLASMYNTFGRRKRR